MKRILMVVALIAMTTSLFAQRGGAPNWLSIAGKAGIGTSVMLCQELSDQDEVSQEFFNPAVTYGGRLGVVFIDRVGASFEYNGSQLQQKFTKNVANGSLHSNLKLKTSDILALFRYTGEYGFYAELGPKFSTIKDVTREFDGKGAELMNAMPLAVDDRFNGKYTSIVFGLGGNVYNGDRVQVGLGVRFGYCGKNILDADKLLTSNIDPWYDNISTNIEVKPLTAQIMLEVNYHFARFGSATCGKQKIIFFK